MDDAFPAQVKSVKTQDHFGKIVLYRQKRRKFPFRHGLVRDQVRDLDIDFLRCYFSDSEVTYKQSSAE